MRLLTRPLRALLAALGLFTVAARRLWSGPVLALAAAFGLTVIVAFTLAMPLYTDAVYHRVLGTEIARSAGWRRPEFAFLFRYVSRGQADTERDEWTQLTPVDQFLSYEAPSALDLPRRFLVRYFTSDSFPVFPATSGDTSSTATYDTGKQALTYLSVGHLSDLEAHATITEGRWPQDMASPDDPIEVLVSQSAANELGLQVGEKYVIFANKVPGHKAQALAVVTGIWAPNDASDPYWFTDPFVFDTTLLTTESNYARYVAPRLRGDTSLSAWYMDFDDSGVRSDNVPGLLDRMAQVLTRAEALLPGIRLEASPQRSLERYQQKSRLLTIQLLAFSAPMLLLLFAFITLVAGLMADSHRNEIAVLRSRGASTVQVVMISLLEAGVLAGVALAAGVLVGVSIARLIGLTRTFLSFVRVDDLKVLLTPASLQVGLLAAAIATIFIVAPVIGSARHTIITYKQRRARTMQAPWWQRVGLDLLLLIPAAYGTYLLRQQGTIALPRALTTTSSEDPFGNPLLFLVPAFAMVALTLFLLRVMPIFLRLLARILGLTPGVSMVQATRQLARTPSFYAAPLLLLVLTLSLATFTASLAATLDQHLLDRVQYRIGSDMSLTEAELTTTPATLPGQTTDDTSNEATPEKPQRAFVPMSEYADVEGVAEATNVGSYKATARFGTGNVTGQLVGVDRVGFPRVAFWRRDFANARLGTLMNALATSPDAILLPESVMSAQGLNVGDRVRITVNLPEGQGTIPFTIAGSFHLWPGWYPDPENPLVRSSFVANLDYISEQVGVQLPYRVWLKLEPGAEPARVVEGVDRLGVFVLRADDTQELIASEQARPERQGLFGVLSVGFAAAALLTVLGFFLSVLFSLRRRYIELGVLRAVGLSSGQMAVLLGWEMVLLLGTGMVAGTLMGVTASRMYIPFLQIGLTAEARTVPFQVILPWPALYAIYALFGAMFVIALGALIVFALRMKVFQAVKLGETE